jgi:hypothetical protein
MELTFAYADCAAPSVSSPTAVNTEDFDIVHDRSKDNVTRLLAALAELGAVYRDDSRQLRPSESRLVGSGNQLFQTGRLKLDVLGSIDPR